jgi:hypothetical protein
MLVCAESKTSAGFWVIAEPYVVLPLATEPEALGNAVIEALSHSLGDVPTPKDWKALAQRRLKAAGTKSEKDFQSGSRLVAIKQSSAGLTVEPHHNGGAHGEKKGFHELKELEVVLTSNASHDQIGTAVLEAFTKCTSAT